MNDKENREAVSDTHLRRVKLGTIGCMHLTLIIIVPSQLALIVEVTDGIQASEGDGGTWNGNRAWKQSGAKQLNMVLRVWAVRLRAATELNICNEDAICVDDMHFADIAQWRQAHVNAAPKIDDEAEVGERSLTPKLLVPLLTVLRSENLLHIIKCHLLQYGEKGVKYAPQPCTTHTSLHPEDNPGIETNWRASSSSHSRADNNENLRQ